MDLFALYNEVGAFSCLMCPYVDDILGKCDAVFERKMKDLDALVGFGSVQRNKFVHYGRVQKTSQCENPVFMSAYIDIAGER